VRKTGSYTVMLDYYCDPKSAGGTYEILVGSSRLQRKIASTGGWNLPQAVKLGTMEIDRTGVVNVQIKPISVTGEALMAFRTLLLRPRTQMVGDAVAQLPDGSVQLSAPDGKIVGKNAQFEDENIGYWTNQNDYVEWKFQTKSPGKYTVSVDYACPPVSAGADYEVVIGDQRLLAKVAATASWRDFRPLDLGTVEIDRPAISTLQVKPVKLEKGALMNLRNVFLRPVK